MAVSSYVMEYGGSETQAIVALLHDTIEDCDVSATDLAQEFGPYISALVEECSEPLPEKGEHSWKGRKDAYISQVSHASDEALLVILCDKYHNLLSLWRDIENRGELAWGIFKEPKSQLFWYYDEMRGVFSSRKSFDEKRAAGLVKLFSNLVDLVFSEVREL